MLDAFYTTLIAVLLAEMGGRSQILCAALALRFDRDGPIIAGAMLAALANIALSAWAGSFVPTWVSEDAVALFHALSLLAAGIGMLAWQGKVDPLDRWRTGAFLTAFSGIFILQLGDKGQFIVAGQAARYEEAVWVALGGICAVAIAWMPAILLRAQLAEILPLAWIRRAGGVILLVFGLYLTIGAYRLFA